MAVVQVGGGTHRFRSGENYFFSFSIPFVAALPFFNTQQKASFGPQIHPALMFVGRQALPGARSRQRCAHYPFYVFRRFCCFCRHG